MMSNPEVSYTRPPHPDKITRPPPKSFADFQSAADAAKNPDSVKQSFVPKPGETVPSAEFTQSEMRIGLLEQRIENLENMAEELTDAATKPAQTADAAFMVEMVRMAVVDGIVSYQAALLAIARKLGLVDVTTRLQAPAANFQPPPVVDAKPAPMGQSFAKLPRTPAPKEEPEEVGEERGGPQEPPGKRFAGRPSAAMKKSQDAPRRAIIALMSAHGISQAKVERASGLPQGALSRWLRGGVTFDPTFIPRVEKAIKKLV